mgnify:CR=1 FL=1
MAGVNKVILVGNLGKDPEVRHLDSGVAVANFSLATTESYTNKQGERVNQTEWHNIVLWRGLADIAEKYLNDPVRVSVSKSSTPAPNIKQDTIKVSDGEKYTSLLTSLDERDGSIIVFVKTKRGTEKMAKRLQKEGHSAEAIHGDLKQSKRDRVIASFRKMKYRILVATDVAARGLDIPHIEHVINYDLPQCAEDYVHRIGRTARAGATGSALSFITPADRGKWGAIDRLLNPNSKKESRSRKPSSRKPSRKRPSNAAPRGDVVQLRRDKKKKWSTSKPKKAA